MSERQKTQRDRLRIAGSILFDLYNSVLAGETIGREKLDDIREALCAVRGEPEAAPTPYKDRYFLTPVLSFGQSFNSPELPRIMVQLLRDAIGEFSFNRMPVADYIVHRYPGMAWEQKVEKQKEVLYRVRLAQDLAVERVEVSAFDPRMAG
jgi:hypothetical protein